MKKNNFFGYTLFELVIAITLSGFLVAMVSKWFPRKMEKTEPFFQGFRQLEAFILRAERIYFQVGKIFLEVEETDQKGERHLRTVSIAVVSHYNSSLGSDVWQFCWPSVHSQEWYVWSKKLNHWERILEDTTIGTKSFFKWVLKDSKQEVLEKFIFQSMYSRAPETLEKE